MKARLLLLCSCLYASFTYGDTFYALGTNKETLGMGFSSEVNMPLSPCVTGDWIFQGGSQGELAFQQGMDSTTMMNSVSGSVRGSVNFVIFGGSAKFSMRKKTTENRNSIASTLMLNYNGGNYSLENRRITDEIASLIHTDPAAVVGRCGDSYIHSLTKGANLYVTAKLYFRDKTEYEWFQTKIKIRVLFFKKTITKTKEFSNAIKNAVYSVQVHTDGGLTPYLQSIGTSKYCRGTDISACTDYADQLFSYLLAGGNYASDLTPELLKPIKYTVEPYEKSGHMTLIPASANNMPADYLRISGRLRGYQDLVNDEIERLKAFIAVATEAEKPALEAEFALRQSESNALADAGEYCATLPGVYQCEQRVEQAIAQVH
ncbi:hypothetical protein OE749_13395 [Aestuariibacter sp. AA17]|uniref:Integrating conjugative element protein, PFL_4711 family n=1 Tax=Fluctibacter corallii TaxID=2984329 RepID=A0ABT3AAI6_9ALTE|nr:hypothetical protein [Aestuariibacter sp. AA17]MCV2885687.1 hypothetical protein [Aestuariibacter sp. AA17]